MGGRDAVQLKVRFEITAHRHVPSSIHARGEKVIRFSELTGLAVVNVGFTVASGVAWFAATQVTSQGILAGRSVAAGILHTLVDVNLTGLALERRRATFTSSLDKLKMRTTVPRLQHRHTNINSYLAIHQGRRRRSSHSPPTPYTHLHACRVWSYREPASSHSSLL